MNAPINHESLFKIDSEGYRIMPDVWNKCLLMEWLSGGGYEGVCDILNQHKKLKAENEKYKHWASEVIYWSDTHTKNILEEKKLITKDNKPTIDNVRDFGKEIQELKAENEKLKEQINGDNLWGINKGLKQEKSDLIKRYKIAVKEIVELQEENEKLSMKSKVQSDLIDNLLAHIIREADIDDGISISDEYGCKYIDSWNKEYDELIKEHIETMN